MAHTAGEDSRTSTAAASAAELHNTFEKVDPSSSLLATEFHTQYRSVAVSLVECQPAFKSIVIRMVDEHLQRARNAAGKAQVNLFNVEARNRALPHKCPPGEVAEAKQVADRWDDVVTEVKETLAAVEQL